jgi:hypothetical protein
MHSICSREKSSSIDFDSIKMQEYRTKDLLRARVKNASTQLYSYPLIVVTRQTASRSRALVVSFGIECGSKLRMDIPYETTVLYSEHGQNQIPRCTPTLFRRLLRVCVKTVQPAALPLRVPDSRLAIFFLSLHDKRWQ